MKVCKLVSKTSDDVVIYRSNEKFCCDNIFIGSRFDIPADILRLDVICFGARVKGFLDIQVNV